MMGWAGFNEPEIGITLLFNVVYPQKENHPDAKDEELWRDFVMNTTQLNEHDTFKVGGQDLQPGYTVANIGGMKLKISAEKRKRDGKVQIVVTPFEPTVKYEFVRMKKCFLGSMWNYGAPSLKVYGNISKKHGEGEIVMDEYPLSILLQTVPEFTVDIKEAKDRKDVYVHQN